MPYNTSTCIKYIILTALGIIALADSEEETARALFGQNISQLRAMDKLDRIQAKKKASLMLLAVQIVAEGGS
jgi:hypothetical protein